MPILSLSCVNCSAPLQIDGNADRFFCMHCGSAQILEPRASPQPPAQSDSAVALTQMQNALDAVQRGTDRTAAELAIARLTRERDGILAQRNQALNAQAQRQASSRKARLYLSGGVLLVVSLTGTVALNDLSGDSSMRALMNFVWLAAILGLPTLAFFLTGPSRRKARQLASGYSERLAAIEEQLRAHRAVVDGHHG